METNFPVKIFKAEISGNKRLISGRARARPSRPSLRQRRTAVDTLPDVFLLPETMTASGMKWQQIDTCQLAGLGPALA